MATKRKAEWPAALKRLKWKSWKARHPPHEETWETETVFGTIRVEQVEHGDELRWRWSYCFDEYYDEAQIDCESLDAGKAEAEAFYLGRILPALAKGPTQ